MDADPARHQDLGTALEVLVRESSSAVFGLCLSYTRNVHDAEDLTQEALLKATSSIGELRDPGSIRSWVLQIARRICINHYHRSRSMQRLPEDVPAQPASADPRIEHLQAAMARLPDDYRETLSIYYLDGRSCAAVAEALGISEGAVRVRLTRGRLMLHKLLKEDDQ